MDPDKDKATSEIKTERSYVFETDNTRYRVDANGHLSDVHGDLGMHFEEWQQLLAALVDIKTLIDNEPKVSSL